MKILLIELDGIDPVLLFEDDQLENIRRIMELGCFGLLHPLSSSAPPSDPIADVVANAGRPLVVIAAPNFSNITNELSALKTVSQEQFSLARQALQDQDWDYFHIVEPTLMVLHKTPAIDQVSISGYYKYLDEQIGSILDLLSNDTILVLLSSGGVLHQEGCFIIVPPNYPLRGELHNLTVQDIAPTTLQMAGYELPADLPGKSLVADLGLNEFTATELTEEEEAILRERLSGLGYI